MNVDWLCTHFRLRNFRFLVLFLFLTICSPEDGRLNGQEDAKKKPPGTVVPTENPFPNRHPAPELDGAVEWLNTSAPLSIKDVRGKIVLVDFWTFCCINCMHVLPDLAYLEKKYPRELVVIGVHSAKFDNEKETGNIRKAILRYEIEHPVANDAEMILWRKFGVNSWPSLVVLDPEGQYCGFVSGEGNRETLENVIERLIAYHRFKGTLDETPIHFDLERVKSADTVLKFPGKVLADRAGRRLFISDSNHNRVVVCSLEGKLLHVIGRGTIGRKDGRFAEAEFDHPQGMTLINETLHVADTENHLLRMVDLKQQSVSTLGGTGSQDRARHAGGSLQQTPLNSPWDLTIVDGVMYVAMAGPHQIWSHKLGQASIWPYAGSGREDIRNGSLTEAAFAQPSGIVNDGHSLFVVDSEGSAVRQILMSPKSEVTRPIGEVTTIAGTHDLPRGRSLFEFGDVDAVGDDARFQHPLGIVLYQGAAYIADSYNHKIKRVDLATRKVTTWIGTGKSGTQLSPLQLAEPAGLAIADDMMYVADTNNHRIIVIDMATKEAKELTIDGLTAPQPPALKPQSVAAGQVTKVDLQELVAGNGIPFQIQLSLPEGYKLNKLFPASYKLQMLREQSLVQTVHLNVKQEVAAEGTLLTFTVPTNQQTGEATLLLSVTYGYCREGTGGLCKIGTSSWEVPVALKAKATETSIQLTITAK